MNYIYLVLSLLMIGYLLLKKRKLDFITLAGFSTLFYCYPAFTGMILVDGEYLDIIPEVYACLLIHISVLIIFAILYDIYDNRKREPAEFSWMPLKNKIISKRDAIVMYMIALLGMVLMIYTMIHYKDIPLNQKNVLLSNSNRLIEYYKYISLFLFGYAFVFHDRKLILLKCLSLIMIGYTFLLGHRSFIVIGLIVIVLNHFVNITHGKRIVLAKLLAKKKLITLAILIGMIFFLFVKNVYAAFMGGNYALVIKRLTSGEYYINSLLSSEANSILRNLQYACTTDFNYGIGDYFCGLLKLIPGLGGMIFSAVGAVSFEQALNVQYNEALSEGFGMGSTFLGEAYAAGSYIFLAILVVGLLWGGTALFRLSKKIRHTVWYCWIQFLLAYFAFYIFRNSLINILVTGRALLYIVILSSVLMWMFRYKDYFMMKISSFARGINKAITKKHRLDLGGEEDGNE